MDFSDSESYSEEEDSLVEELKKLTNALHLSRQSYSANINEYLEVLQIILSNDYYDNYTLFIEDEFEPNDFMIDLQHVLRDMIVNNDTTAVNMLIEILRYNKINLVPDIETWKLTTGHSEIQELMLQGFDVPLIMTEGLLKIAAINNDINLLSSLLRNPELVEHISMDTLNKFSGQQYREYDIFRGYVLIPLSNRFREIVTSTIRLKESFDEIDEAKTYDDLPDIIKQIVQTVHETTIDFTPRVIANIIFEYLDIPLSQSRLRKISRLINRKFKY